MRLNSGSLGKDRPAVGAYKHATPGVTQHHIFISCCSLCTGGPALRHGSPAGYLAADGGACGGGAAIARGAQCYGIEIAMR